MNGRTPKLLEQETVNRVLEAIRLGNTLDAAAKCAGLAPSTLRLWRQKGREDKDSIYSAFLAEVKKAQAEAESHFVGIVKSAADDGTWQAAAWWLERRRHQKWGRKDMQRIDAKVENISPKDAREWLTKIKASIPELERRAAEEERKLQ